MSVPTSKALDSRALLLSRAQRLLRSFSRPATATQPLTAVSKPTANLVSNPRRPQEPKSKPGFQSSIRPTTRKLSPATGPVIFTPDASMAIHRQVAYSPVNSAASVQTQKKMSTAADTKKIQETRVITELSGRNEFIFKGNVTINCALREGVIIKVVNGYLILNHYNTGNNVTIIVEEGIYCENIGKNCRITAKQINCKNVGENSVLQSTESRIEAFDVASNALLNAKGGIYCNNVGKKVTMTASEIECETIGIASILQSTQGSIRASNVADGAQLTAKTDIVAKTVFKATLTTRDGGIIANSIYSGTIIKACQGVLTTPILRKQKWITDQIMLANEAERAGPRGI